MPFGVFGWPKKRFFHKLPPWISSLFVETTLIIFILVVVVSNLLPKTVESKGGSVLFGNFNNNNNAIVAFEEYFLGSRNYQAASLTSSLRATFVADSSQSLEFAQSFEYQLVTNTGKNFLVNPSNPLTTASGESRDEIIIYEVQVGDNPSTIAAYFGITTNTLLWANNLGLWDYIRPGDELKILPVSGVVHKVKSGDTIESIAKKYKANPLEIITFNDLSADGKIEPDQELVVPDGVKYTPIPTRVYATSYPKSTLGGHKFPWGQCTWYVATRRYVPWSGHAKQWLANAKARGFQVCLGSTCTPQVGAIVSLKGSSWFIRRYGHVAYVEKVTSSTITISEMNTIGLGVKSVRVLPKNSWLIRGYIY